MSIKREAVNDGRAREWGGGDDRLGCHASVKMLRLEESAERKQGGKQGDACKVFGFFVKTFRWRRPFSRYICLFVCLSIHHSCG